MTKTFIFVFLSLIFGGFSRIVIPVSRMSTPLDITDVKTSHSNFLASTHTKIDHTILNKFNRFYFGDIVAGQQKEKFTVIFDTGSNDLWLATQKCTACRGDHRFNCEKSNTCTRTDEDVEIQYGLGYVKGKKGSDMIGFSSDLTLKQKLFLIDEGKDLENYKGIDGIMGLGSNEKANDWIDLAYDQGLIDDKVFSFIMDNNPAKTTDVLTDKSKLIIGYIPEEHVNKLMWVPISDTDRWWTDLLSAKIGNKHVTPSSMKGENRILLDTGTSYSFLPSDVADELKRQLYPERMSYLMTEFYPCSEEKLPTLPNVTLYMRGVAFNFTARQYLDFNTAMKFTGKTGDYCTPSFYSTGLKPGIPPILGDAIFRDNLIAFSKRNQTMGLNIPGMVPLKPISTKVHQWVGLVTLIALIVAMRIASSKLQNFRPPNENALLQNQAKDSFATPIPIATNPNTGAVTTATTATGATIATPTAL